MYSAYNQEVGEYIFFINKCYIDNTIMSGEQNFCHYKEYLVLEMSENSCLWSECLLIT